MKYQDWRLISWFLLLTHLVCIVSTNFTVVRDVEAVQLVQPVGDGLPVPAERQVLRVVGDVVLGLLLHLLDHLLVIRLLPLGVSPGLKNVRVIGKYYIKANNSSLQY